MKMQWNKIDFKLPEALQINVMNHFEVGFHNFISMDNSNKSIIQWSKQNDEIITYLSFVVVDVWVIRALGWQMGWDECVWWLWQFEIVQLGDCAVVCCCGCLSNYNIIALE